MSAPDLSPTHAVEILFGGPGAEESNDWSKVIQAQANHTLYADQSEGLPAEGSYSLYQITPKLTSNADFEEWHQKICQVLQYNQLSNLIEIECKRPMRNHPDSKKWYFMSLGVQSWIQSCMDDDLASNIRGFNNETMLADHFMKELRKRFWGEGMFATDRVFNKWSSLRRSDFGSSIQFVNAVQTWHKKMDDLDCNIPPFYSAMKILNDLEALPHLEQTMRIKRDALQKTDCDKFTAKFTIEMFYDTCVDWLKDINRIEGCDTLGYTGLGAGHNVVLCESTTFGSPY